MGSDAAVVHWFDGNNDIDIIFCRKIVMQVCLTNLLTVLFPCARDIYTCRRPFLFRLCASISLVHEGGFPSMHAKCIPAKHQFYLFPGLLSLRRTARYERDMFIK